MSTVSLFDSRSFFEKALIHGVQHGIIPPEKIEAMNADAPKGIVQIARYFGSEYLRPELEKAKDRMLNLISLYLEHSTDGDVHKAAELLRDHSFLSRSKGGSDMLKSLIAMPQNSHFGMHEGGGFTNDHIPQLAKWALRPLSDYRLELAQRSQVALVMEAAIHLADTLGLDAEDLAEAGKDAEAVIRTALLLSTLKRTDMPDWVAFENLVLALRKKHAQPGGTKSAKTAKAPQTPKVPKTTPAAAGKALNVDLPKKLPERFVPVVQAMREQVLRDLPKILDANIPVRKLFCQTPAFVDRYFWLEDLLAEVDHFERSVSKEWDKATGGQQDDGSLLTLFLCVAAGSPPKTTLTEKGAAALVRKIRKSGVHPERAIAYIEENAPEQHRDDYIHLWCHFYEEAHSTLLSDQIHGLADAVSLLRRECHVVA